MSDHQTLTLTYDQALDGLRAAVADRGEDFVYSAAYDTEHEGGCQNFTNGGQPACIAGYVYSLHGIRGEGPWPSASVDFLRDRWGVLYVDDRTERLLAVAQQEQDCGRTWGTALELAIEATTP